MSRSRLLQQRPSPTAEEHGGPGEGWREEGVQPECWWSVAGHGGEVVVRIHKHRSSALRNQLREMEQ